MTALPRSSTPYLPYNLALGLVAPLVLPYAAARDLRRIGQQGLGDRWGGLRLSALQPGPRIWIHAASVGETMVAASVIRDLRVLRPDLQIVFSNITATGHETALRLIPDVEHIYFPFDFPGAVHRALHAVRPEVCVMVETELWPNFIHLARRAGARMILVNGRLSDRTLRRASLPLVRGIFRWMLTGLDQLGFQTRVDADRAIALGADPAHVHIEGNTKFDQALVDDPPPEEVAAEIGFPAGAPTLVAGSTHAGEDEAVLDAFVEVLKAAPDARLILAPRRLERLPGLREALAARRLEASFRSDYLKRNRSAATGAPQPAAAPVMVLDTIGELRRVYALARIAFVGGTLAPVGGHDLLQPLAKRVPVLFGPHTHNCREIAGTILESAAGQRISGSQELAREWIRLLKDDAAAAAMGERGMALLLNNRGASRRYAEMIESLLKG